MTSKEVDALATDPLCDQIKAAAPLVGDQNAEAPDADFSGGLIPMTPLSCAETVLNYDTLVWQFVRRYCWGVLRAIRCDPQTDCMTT